MQILWTISSVCIVKHYFMYCTRHPIFLLFKNCKIVLLFQCPRDFVSWICSSVLCAAVVVRRDIWSLLREYLLSHWKVKTSWDAHLIWQMFFHQICWIKIYHHKWQEKIERNTFPTALYEMIKWQKLVMKVRNCPKWKENITWQKYLT